MKGEDFRKALDKSLDPSTYLHTYGMFEYVHRLFEQATRSFDAESYDAVCLLCRSTVEAACYLYLTRKKVRAGRITGTLSSPPRKLDNSLRRIFFEELRKGVSEKKVLSDKQLTNLVRIKKHGDTIAHIAGASDEKLWRSVEKKKLNFDPFNIVPRIQEDEASEDLEDTISIITTLAKAAMKDVSEQ